MTGTGEHSTVDKAILFLATGFGLGRMPVVPGTFGTLAALPVVWLMSIQAPTASAFTLACLILASIFLADKAEKLLGGKDPGAVVIDEVAGFSVAMSLLPLTWGTFIMGFLAFRLFDIFKSRPVKYFENNFSGGAGIVLDDIMAGVLAGLAVKILYTLF